MNGERLASETVAPVLSFSRDKGGTIHFSSADLSINGIKGSIKAEKFNFNSLLKKFLNFLVIKRRLFYLENILKDFLLICSQQRGELSAKLISSKNLTESEINKIKDELSKNFASNINLSYKFDPSLIGGLVIQVGSMMIDTSIKNKLQQIENRMIEV